MQLHVVNGTQGKISLTNAAPDLNSADDFKVDILLSDFFGDDIDGNGNKGVGSILADNVVTAMAAPGGIVKTFKGTINPVQHKNDSQLSGYLRKLADHRNPNAESDFKHNPKNVILAGDKFILSNPSGDMQVTITPYLNTETGTGNGPVKLFKDDAKVHCVLVQKDSGGVPLHATDKNEQLPQIHS